MANKISEQMKDQAVSWHVRLESDAATEADWLAFTDWLEANEAHRAAYDAVEDLVIELGSLQADAADHSAPAEDPAPSVVIDARHRFGRMRGWATAAMAVAAALLAVVSIQNFGSPDYVVQEYMTGAGEQRLITLEDGTTVRLNTNSRIKVAFEDDVRRTELAYGQAVYNVAKDAGRPFMVGMGDSTVRVVGTVFDILRHKGQVRVTVAEGVVEVAPVAPESTQKTERLLPGSQLTHAEGSEKAIVTKVDPARVMAWEAGYLEYDDARLEDVIADLNRYFPSPIRVVGEAAELRFSGTLQTDDEETALLVISSGLPLTIEKRHGEVLLRMKRKQGD